MRPPLSIHANGKILISGEYLVMQGATALAVPLKVGQELSLEAGDKAGILSWESYDTEGIWFSGLFSLPGLAVLESSDDTIAKRLKKLLLAARSLNLLFLSDVNGLKAVTRLGFNRNWGFGSSSTLISLVARWAGIQPMELHRLVSNGSGYDVACSVAESPVFFKTEGNGHQAAPVDFNPSFAENMFLIYLGNKQHSDTEVDNFRQQSGGDLSRQIQRISEISFQLAKENNLEGFMNLLSEHENIIAGILGRGTVKEMLFSDFKGVVKSMGAWGGDFILAVSALGEAYIRDYFIGKSLLTLLPYSSVALLTNKKVIRAV
jgi:mevalonate kinase